MRPLAHLMPVASVSHRLPPHRRLRRSRSRSHSRLSLESFRRPLTPLLLALFLPRISVAALLSADISALIAD